MISINTEPVNRIEIKALGKPAITISMALRNTCP